MEFKFKVGDLVRVKSGKNHHDYVCGWSPKMDKFVGKVYRIVGKNTTRRGAPYYFLEGCTSESCSSFSYSFDERYLKLVAQDQIIIERYGKRVIATMGDKMAVAKCSPEDEFDYAIGAKLALDRLLEEEEVKSKFEVGDIVICVTDKYPITGKGWKGMVVDPNLDINGHIKVRGKGLFFGVMDYDVDQDDFKLVD